MDEGATARHIGPVDPVELLSFLDHLRDQHGFNIGTDEYLAAQRLATLWDPHGHPTLHSLLAPLLCSASGEMPVFDSQYAYWEPRLLVRPEEVGLDTPEPPPPGPDDRLNQVIASHDKSRRRFWWVSSLLSLLVVSLLVLFLASQCAVGRDLAAGYNAG